LRFNRWVPTQLAQVIDWYNAKSTVLGDRCRAAADETLDAIERAPETYPYAFRGLEARFHRLRRFPYLMLYRVEKSVIHVVAVCHGAGNPDKWRRRVSTAGTGEA
jgi:hypothetical protein